VRAFILDGRPCSTPSIGSYEGWSRWVRDPLIWLGRADPAETMELARGSDPRLAALKTILAQWSAQIGDLRITEQEVIAKASERGAMNSRRYRGQARDADAVVGRRAIWRRPVVGDAMLSRLKRVDAAFRDRDTGRKGLPDRMAEILTSYEGWGVWRVCHGLTRENVRERMTSI
jgi:hypothetical protein